MRKNTICQTRVDSDGIMSGEDISADSGDARKDSDGTKPGKIYRLIQVTYGRTGIARGSDQSEKE